MRGVRGATTVETNKKEEITVKVSELLLAIITENKIATQDIGAVIFSSTPDLDATFPATGARNLGWDEVPLFGTAEIDCPGALTKCIRVLILWNTDLSQSEIRHIYLHGATALRPDIVNKMPVS